jgi:ribosomal protein L11 methylase PrmA
MLVRHHDVTDLFKSHDDEYLVIEPERIPFISYPYEWCFSQLKAAALLTLRIQKKTLDKGMILKDSSAYNIQFMHGLPVLIDTLSFERYEQGKPWIAFRQFCQHFLAPLTLMSLKDVRLNQLLRIYIDGIPLDLVSSVLSLRSWFSFSTLVYIHLHARSQKRFSDREIDTSRREMTLKSLFALTDSLESAVEKLELKKSSTFWTEYYKTSNYSVEGFDHKREVVAFYFEKARHKIVWDIGANTGLFSRMAGETADFTVAFDMDPLAVETNFRVCSQEGVKNVLPLLADLTNPSPAIGWANSERMSLAERGPADLVLALALVHHLAITNNVPFNDIAVYLHDLCLFLIIEFVPKTDSNAQRLMRNRKDSLEDYNQNFFEQTFCKYFKIHHSTIIKHTNRVVYLMERIPL